MLHFITNNKMMVGGVLGAGLLVWAYFMFFGGGTGELLVASSSPSPVSQDLLVTLSNLRTIALDETIFSDPVFMSLSDFGVVIPPEAIGRRNPFAPLGAASTPAAEPTEESETESP